MRLVRIVAPLVLFALIGTAHAQSFDQFHPDQYSRETGFDRYDKGYKSDAVRFFTKGARFADKTCQIALAIMYFTGDGVTKDEATGYAWADLAAERGYPEVVAMRERMWAALDETQRARALEVGRPLHDEYADAVAKPRLERLLRRGKSQRIGSRTGSATAGGGTIPMDASSRAAFLTAWQQTPGLQENASMPSTKEQRWNAMMNVLRSSIIAVQGNVTSNYYGPENWDPKFYWRAQDSLWVPDGRVTVGELKKGKGRLRE